jgi:glycosyltransferase involved in cell wall biosynthesis
MKHAMKPKYVLYLAVLPFYRQECIRLVKQELGEEAAIFAGSRHIDATVTTGIAPELYTKVRNVRLASRGLVQLGGWRTAMAAEHLVVDLNPRSLNAWVQLLVRRALGRRTLAWGHLDPRAGSASRTRGLRTFMRSVASGTILYGYGSVQPARKALPTQPVWVAPNSLYSASEMRPAIPAGHSTAFLYVGRLVPEKKVDLLVRAIAHPQARAVDARLDIVGEGAERDSLERLANTLNVSDRVHFHGSITDSGRLFELYESSVAAVSPGYAGLSLTQSVGFGVPILVADDEPHAPEIELVRLGGVRFFTANSAASLAEAMAEEVANRLHQHRVELSRSVKASYSAEAMAAGLLAALQDRSQNLGDDGWPK